MTLPAPWLPVPQVSPYPISNLPYGVFSTGSASPRVGVAIGDHVLDAGAVATAQGSPHAPLLTAASLNPLLAAGPQTWSAVRRDIVDWLTVSTYRAVAEPHLVSQSDVTLHLPFTVGDYVDFYASEQHATNLGRILRPGQEPLLPNWRHLPVGYHGRSGTVVVSGTPVRRPCGQRRGPAADAPPAIGPPVFGATERLDIEAEVGFVVGAGSTLGEPVPVDGFEAHVFGVCLVNDWSARDIQAWEYQPLGPFLGKSFATSVSPWVVPLAALSEARVPVGSSASTLLPYLSESAPWGLDLSLEIRLNGEVVSRPPYRLMHWSPAQMLAHMTVNGASVRPGDLFASGTVSGPSREERGSLIELSWNGSQPLTLSDGSTRVFLEDGDEVTISATAPGVGGTTIGLGSVTGRVLPAH